MSMTFESDDAPIDASDKSVLHFARIVSVMLGGVALTFAALDIAEVRTLHEGPSFWSSRVKPAFAAVLSSHDADVPRAVRSDMPLAMQASLTASFDADDGEVVIRPIPVAMRDSEPASTRRSSPAAPYVLPEPAARLSLSRSAPNSDALDQPRSRKANAKAGQSTALMMLASASPSDLLSITAEPVTSAALFSPPTAAQPLERPSTAGAPATAAPPTFAALASPALSLSAVPLPRPSPAREPSEPKPPTPAELLGLDASPKERARAEKCLANAVYFESRSEPVRGQIAVAQVVMNRVFSPFYPKDVCSVVYQNAHRRLSCQFTFACDGKSKAIHDRGSWARANRIAKQTLDGKLWVPEVAKSTHYHAQYVRPNWVREMRKNFKTGLHMFYRPYNWGDGSDEPGWVKPLKPTTVAAAKTN